MATGTYVCIVWTGCTERTKHLFTITARDSIGANLDPVRAQIERAGFEERRGRHGLSKAIADTMKKEWTAEYKKSYKYQPRNSLPKEMM